MPSSTLTINGTAYSQAGRKASSYIIDAWGWDLDGDYSLEFHEYSAGPQSSLSGPVPVSLTVDGTLRFTGDLISTMPTIGDERTFAHRCLGLKNRANWIPVTALDGTGTMRFNTSPIDIDNYVPANAGKSVGDIIAAVLTQHAAALTAAGITTDATTTAQLAARTLVPVDEVIVQGERLWQALESVIQRWDRNQRLIILPSGLVRLIPVNGGTSRTLTVGSDFVEPPLFTRNWSHCATRTVVRGRGDIEPAYVSQLHATLTPAWSGANEAAWTIDDFADAGNALDSGTVVSVDSPTQVTVSSADPARTWATNSWDDLEGWIYLRQSSGSGSTYTEARRITANSALTAGGSATITLAFDLENGTAGSFNSYKIISRNTPLSTGGLADVWRLYDVTDPGGLIADHLVLQFPVQVPFVDYYGQSAQQVTSPVGQIVHPNGAGPAFFQVLPQTGQILFFRPVVEMTSSPAQLAAGGANVIPPDDIYLLLAYSRGALSAVFPPDSGGPVYSGTAYTQAGLARTQYVDVDSWAYKGNVLQMVALAQMLQESTRDTLLEGTVSVYGYYSTLEDPSGGHLLRLPAVGYTSGDATLDIPVRGVTYQYITGGGGLLHATSIRCSTRRDPRTGESQYMHLSVLGAGGIIGGQLSGAFGGAAAWGMNIGATGGAAGYTAEGLGLAGGPNAADVLGGPQGRLAPLGGQAGITTGMLGLDQSAQELGTQAMQAGSQFEQGLAATAQGPARGPAAARNKLGLKGVKSTQAGRAQAAAGLGASEAAEAAQLETQVAQDNARRNAGMARGPARDTTLRYGQPADAGDFTGPPRSAQGRGARPGRRRLRGGATSEFGAGISGAEFGAGLPGLGAVGETETDMPPFVGM